ncbi:hypothetical protein GDO78_019325 [Eleutherodactylus coqui]|uniref:Secreted protein n=1 Tax=Eleutherodactylus coqui TaxID=57060 RepID=A0A8J6E6C6_ELECQ|nr:hypothetical protein GDO78_019325 [Eleutherodactylus coqui]
MATRKTVLIVSIFIGSASIGSNGSADMALRTQLRFQSGTSFMGLGRNLAAAVRKLLTHLLSANFVSHMALRAATWTFRVLGERPICRPSCKNSKIKGMLGIESPESLPCLHEENLLQTFW